MKKIISLIMAAAILLSAFNVAFADEVQTAADNTKPVLVIDEYGGVKNSEAYIKTLTDRLSVPEPEGITEVLENAGMAGVHPRLFATKADFERIDSLKASDEFMRNLYLKIVEYTDNMIQKPIWTMADSYSDKLDFAREMLDRMLLLGEMYQLTGDIKYYTFADEQARLAISECTGWSSVDVLQTAEMTAAMAIAYDWLFDAMTDDFKEVLKGFLKTRIDRISVNYYPVPQGFARQVNNWNAVCNGSYGLAALAILDEESELASKVLNGAVKAITLSIDQFGEDGGFPEGPGYWAYQVQYITYFLSSLDTALKTDFGLSEFEGLKQTPYFLMNMHGPTHIAFNFADSGAGVPQAQFLYWFEKKYGYEGLGNYATRLNPSGTDFGSWESKANDILIMLWYQPSDKDPYENLPKGAVYTGGVTGAALRTKWDDTTATYIGFKGGYNQASHGNLDIGSFVLDALGVRWVDDFGGGGAYYGLEGMFDFDEGRWKYYTERAEGHNTIVLNPTKAADQNIYARAPISEFSVDDGYGIIDMSEAYNAGAKSAKRGFALCGDSVIVRDEIELSGMTDLLWGINTTAGIEILADKKTAILTKGDKKMKVSIISPSDAELSTMKAESLSIKPIPGEMPLDKYKRLIIRSMREGKTDITVQFSPFMANEPEPDKFTKVYPLDEWKNKRIYESNGVVQKIMLDGAAFDDFSPSKLGYTVYLDKDEPVPEITAVYNRVNSIARVTQGEKIGDTAKIEATSRDVRIGKMNYVFNFKEKKYFGKRKDMNEIKMTVHSATNADGELCMDKRLDTCWFCTGEQSIVLDAGSVVPIKLAAIAFKNGMQRVAYFDIAVSKDGETFETVFSGEACGVSNDYEHFKLDDAEGRYIRITLKGTSVGIWSSINEIIFYN